MGRKSQATNDSGDSERSIEIFNKSLRLLSMLSFILEEVVRQWGESKIKNDKRKHEGARTEHSRIS
jgi:hypothetical protein